MKIIAGRFRGQVLQTPKSVATRPTTGMMREAFFNICRGDIQGANFLDLFAGSGAMGFEALSREAAHSTFVEQDRAAVEVIRHNIQKLGVEECTTLLYGDVFKVLPRLSNANKQFDIIFADAPYGQPTAEKLLKMVSDLTLLSKGGQLFIEDASQVSLEGEFSGLELVDQRRYGRSYLQHWRKS